MKNILRKASGIIVMLTLSSCGGSGSGSSSSANPAPTPPPSALGDASLGTSAVLSTKSTSSTIAIPLFNNSSNSIVVGTVTGSSGVSFDLGSCAGQTLSPGNECNILATYSGSSSPTGIQAANYTVEINPGTSNEQKLSGILNYEALESGFNDVFISQSLYPISLSSTNLSTYTTLWLYNSSNNSINFNPGDSVSLQNIVGNGNWSIANSSCQNTLNAGSGCYVTLRYTNNQSNIANALKAVTNGDAPLSTVKITANLDGHNIYTNLNVFAQESDGASLINPSTVNMGNSSTGILPIVNSGTLPIISLSATSSNSGFTVDATSCQSQLALSPGSDSCQINIIKKSGATGTASVEITYADENGSHNVSNIINYGNLTVSPGVLTFNVAVNTSQEQDLTLGNVGSGNLTYAGESLTNLNNDFIVDDSACVGQQIGSCKIKVSYSPKSSTVLQSGSVSFNATDSLGNLNSVIASISYQSFSPSAPNIEFCSDAQCNNVITSDQIAAKVGESDLLNLWIKNTGEVTAPTLSFSFVPVVSSLSLVNNQCGATLASNATCSFAIKYTPTLVESGVTLFKVLYGANTSSLSLNYSSTPQDFAQIVYCNDSQCTQEINSINLNTLVSESISQNVYVLNKGNVPATGVNYISTGYPAGLSVDSSNCGNTLNPNSPTCTLKINFYPTAAASGNVLFKITYSSLDTAKESDLNINYSATQPITGGTYDYDTQFQGGSGVLVKVQSGSSIGNASVVITTNFAPTSVDGACFAPSWESFTSQTTKVNNQYLTTITPNGANLDLTKNCGLHGGASVLSGVQYGVVSGVSVNGTAFKMVSPCGASACSDPGNGSVIQGYYTNWSRYARAYFASSIPYTNLNEVTYAFIGFNGAGNVTSLDSWADINEMPTLAKAKLQYPYLNIMLSFGGWTNAGAYTAPMFNQLTSSQTAIDNFATNATNAMVNGGFNGIDIDWEWWSGDDGNGLNASPHAKEELALLTAIKSKLSQLSKANNQNYYLSIAVSVAPDKIESSELDAANRGVPNFWLQVSQLVDHLSVMAYDMHGAFDNPNPADFQASWSMEPNSPYVNKSYDTVDAINKYTSYGVPVNKLVLGIPAYGRAMQINGIGSNFGLYQPITGTPIGEFDDSSTGNTGVFSYKCIINPNICYSNGPTISALTFIDQDHNKDVFNNLSSHAQEPWGYGNTPQGNIFLTYDNVKTVEYKVQQSKTMGLGGFMLWELDGDSTESQTSLLNTIKSSI